MKKTITGFYVNVDGYAAPREIEASLQSYYDLLECDCIDIVSRKIGGKYYDIVCDDEALLKDDPRVTMLDVNGTPMLFGNLFICSHDGEGNEVSLTPADVNRIQKCIKPFKSSPALYDYFLVGGY